MPGHGRSAYDYGRGVRGGDGNRLLQSSEDAERAVFPLLKKLTQGLDGRTRRLKRGSFLTRTSVRREFLSLRRHETAKVQLATALNKAKALLISPIVVVVVGVAVLRRYVFEGGIEC